MRYHLTLYRVIRGYEIPAKYYTTNNYNLALNTVRRWQRLPPDYFHTINIVDPRMV